MSQCIMIKTDHIQVVLSGISDRDVTALMQSSRKPVGGGACGDIYQGILNPCPTDGNDAVSEPIVVAIKTIRANYKHDRIFVKVRQ